MFSSAAKISQNDFLGGEDKQGAPVCNTKKWLSLDMLGKYLNPRNDIAFKKIFGSEKNKNILLALLNSVLKQQLQGEIKDATFLQRAQDPETAVKKSSVVDLKCEDDAGNTALMIA